MRSISRRYLKELPNKWNKYCATNEARATDVRNHIDGTQKERDEMG